MESRALAEQQSPADEALAFLDWIHGRNDDGFICVATDNPLHTKNRKFRQHFYRWPAERSRVAEFVFTEKYSPNPATGSEVWFSLCQFPARDGVDLNDCAINWRAQRLAHLARPTDVAWCDIDHAAESLTPQELAEADEWVASKGGAVVMSGSGENRHIYIKLNRKLDAKELDRLNRQICAKYQGSDVSKANASSILRLPGTFNHKTPEGSPVRLRVWPDVTVTNDPDELSAELPEPARDEVTPISGDFRECEFVDGSPYGLQAIENILRELRELSGGRNNALYLAGARIGNLVAGGELNGEWAWEQLVSCAREIGDGLPLDEETPRRGFEHGLHNPVNAPNSQLTDADRAALRLQLERWHAKRAALNSTEERPLTSPDEHLPVPWWEGPYDQVASLARQEGKYAKTLMEELLRTVARDQVHGLRAHHLLNVPIEDFERHPFVQAVMVTEMAREWGKRKAQLALMPGNKEVGRPSRRSDCTGVVYDTTAPGLFLQPGWITLFMADYEVGKTMLAYSLAAERLRRGEEVVVIQEDESSDQTWGKIDAFCLTAEEEDRFQPYNYPGWNLVATPEMLDELMERHPGTTLLIIDSVMKIIKLAGLEEDNPGAVALWTIIERFIAKYPQVAVLLIDHQGHNGSGHARGATGKAQMSSIVVQVSSVTKFAKSRDGQVKAKIHKHRNGESTGHTWRGDVIVRDGDEPLQIKWTDEGVRGQAEAEAAGAIDPGKKKLNAADRIILAFQRNGRAWMTVAELESDTGAKRPTIVNALRALGERVAERQHPDNPSAKQFRLTGSV
ncbi:AAA family ATPase [Streptomyces sp. NPDC001034]|uniref:AAA family ATPase n=1 Tax=Streptomyces sp. NPDC001034 TaxID=3154375 RepID=UPI00332F1151